MAGKPKGAGKSSFDIIDHGLLVDEAKALKPASLLDLGCGAGNYSLALAKGLGPGCLVYGVDPWDEGIEQLRARAEEAGLDNLRAMQGDAVGNIPLEDQAVDLVLICTVFHELSPGEERRTALNEVKRVLKPNGALAVVEFFKVDGKPGPPIEEKLSPGELAEALPGFSQFKHLGLGQYAYLSLFRPVSG